MPKTLTRKHTTVAKPEIDFPRQDERVGWPQYTLRVSAPEGSTKVEIAVDQGDWRPCRESNGYWWFDWAGYENGEHEAIARVETRPGRFLLSETREFVVAI